MCDMDGLLLDTEQVALAAFLDTAGPQDLDLDSAAAFFMTMVGNSSAMSHQMLTDYLPGHLDVVAFNDTWNDAFRQRMAHNVPVKPGVADVLQQLSDQGIRMAVVTSTHGKNARHHLEMASIRHHFEHVTGGDEVTANKPNPEPYLETAAKLGVNPKRCGAFEDSDRGITAAVAAGCAAVQIPDLRPAGKPFPELGQFHAASLGDAMRLLNILS